jgi:hypothetical protein
MKQTVFAMFSSIEGVSKGQEAGARLLAVFVREQRGYRGETPVTLDDRWIALEPFVAAPLGLTTARSKG